MGENRWLVNVVIAIVGALIVWFVIQGFLWAIPQVLNTIERRQQETTSPV